MKLSFFFILYIAFVIPPITVSPQCLLRGVLMKHILIQSRKFRKVKSSYIDMIFTLWCKSMQLSSVGSASPMDIWYDSQMFDGASFSAKMGCNVFNTTIRPEYIRKAWLERISFKNILIPYRLHRSWSSPPNFSVRDISITSILFVKCCKFYSPQQIRNFRSAKKLLGIHSVAIIPSTGRNLTNLIS